MPKGYTGVGSMESRNYLEMNWNIGDKDLRKENKPRIDSKDCEGH